MMSQTHHQIQKNLNNPFSNLFHKNLLISYFLKILVSKPSFYNLPINYSKLKSEKVMLKMEDI